MTDPTAARAELDAKNLLTAVEIMTAVLDGYSRDIEDPDASLATYITEQLVTEPGEIPGPIWDVLGGLTTLTHLLLRKVEELGEGVWTKEIALDSFAHAARETLDNPTRP